LKDAVRNLAELCELLDLPPNFATSAATADGPSEPVFPDFPLFVPRGFVARMRKGDPHDPLLRQVLPATEELHAVPGFVVDPVGDVAALRQPGMLHKYAGRVLLVTTGACAIHCRYCFRRHFPYSAGPRSIADWQPALAAIAADNTIHEVILSGGDPLTIADATLAALVDELAKIEHVRRLRVHTRLPVVVPERVTDSLLELLRGSRLAPIVVVHANHVNEIDTHVAVAFAKLTDGGIPLLNQAVLLRGVNDTVEAQAALCERLVNLRVLPYYLHQLDRVLGTAHFEVPVSEGQRIARELRERLPGYAVPRFVAEITGAGSKTVLE
jgi:EF-P beta-lysylation protein EpmB